MKNDIWEKAETYLCELERELSVSNSGTREIVEEARSDLLSHVQRFRDQGKTKEEAVDLAIEEMGNPAIWVKEVKDTIVPLLPEWLKPVRFVAATAIILWALFVLWAARAWTYGVSPVTVVRSVTILSILLVPILLFWPTFVWRRNWLHGLIPVAVCVAIFGGVMMIGVESTETHSLASAVPAVEAGFDRPPIPFRQLPYFLLPIVLATYLISFLQRRRQRLFVIACVVLSLSIIEVAFALEEAAFRRVRDDLVQASAGKAETAKEPVRLFWSRPLSPGFAIAYSSEKNRIWILD